MRRKQVFIEKLPFFWRVIDDYRESGEDVPSLLPFKFDYNQRLRLIIQERNKRTLRFLKVVYKKQYNIGNIQEGKDRNDLYAQDFLNFIMASIKSYPLEIKTVLEIGCGGCLLLERLKEEGYNVLGVDPSPVAKREGERRAVNVVQDFFPSKRINEKFDLIFHSDVLEHVDTPTKFLNLQFAQLNDRGILIMAVPDCTQSIRNGDLSMILHQHWNYFDVESLELTLKYSGFAPLSIQKANYGGSLYCAAQKSDTGTNFQKHAYKRNKDKYKNFITKSGFTTSRVTGYILRVLSEPGRTLGLYAPVRALPYLTLIGSYKNVRLFDDTQSWHKKYLDGVPIPIENFEDLKRKPVTDLLIMSPTFGEVIEKKIVRYLSKKIKIKKLTDFF